MRILRSIRFRVTVLATVTTAVLVFAFGWLLTEQLLPPFQCRGFRNKALGAKELIEVVTDDE